MSLDLKIPDTMLSETGFTDSFANVGYQMATLINPSQSLGIDKKVYKLQKLENAILEPKKYYQARRKKIADIGTDLDNEYKKDFEKYLFERDADGKLIIDATTKKAKVLRSVSQAKKIADIQAKSRYEIEMMLLEEEYPADFSDLATNKLIQNSKLKLNNPDLDIAQKP
jgi:hypothetical protein